MPVWSAINLANVRTEFLKSIELKHIPPAAARAIRDELAARLIGR